MNTPPPSTALLRAAQQGDRSALEHVLSSCQGYVYNLALRMLQNPADAEDATQEILIRILTRLSQFRHQSAFTTWVYRIAVNTLLNIAQRDPTRHQLSFEDLGARLEHGLALAAESVEAEITDRHLTEEVKRHCTLGMVQCLRPQDRMALVLDDVIGLSSQQGAELLGLSAVTYRKRVSRARRALVSFLTQQCGLVNPDSACRCHKHVGPAIAGGRLTPGALHYVQADETLPPPAAPEAAGLDRALRVIREHPLYASRLNCHHLIDQLFTSGDPDRQ
jgi:RNA polymerase sigma factor (sigma-70 family)